MCRPITCGHLLTRRGVFRRALSNCRFDPTCIHLDVHSGFSCMTLEDDLLLQLVQSSLLWRQSMGVGLLTGMSMAMPINPLHRPC